MFDVGWQVWFVLILVGVIVYFILDAPGNPNGIDKQIARLWKRFVEVPEFTVTDDVRALTTARLRSQYPAFADDGVAGALFAQAQGLASSEAAGIRSLEARSLAQICLIAVAVVLLTIFTPRGDQAVPLSAAFGIALFLFFASILANAICSWPARYQPPSLEVYTSPETCQSKELKAPVIFELTESALAYYRNLQVAGIKKGRWLRLGTILLILGVLFLLFNFHFSGNQRPGALPSHYNCPPGNPVLCNRLDQ
ncbi:MAG TPA: hypothetical protein VGI19_07345 [Candidatus Cybelea sp.]|jgi:hypothetical protein